MPVFEEIEACTTLNVEQCTIAWTINNYSSIVKDVPGKYLSSPKFSLGNAAKRQFYLRLYPGGETEKSSQFISLYVYWNKTNNKQEFTCECKFSIITEVTGSIIHKRVFQEKVSNESPGWGYSEFYKKKDYNDMNSMIIRCQLSVFEDTSIDFDIKDHELINRLTFDSLFLSDELSDFKINTSSVKSIAAHKFILAVASPVFRAMFTHDMVENKENSIEIADTSYNILIDMLRYIYTGKILSTKTDEILELLAVADKYQIDNLKIKCGIKLCANLSVINAIEILTAAYKYNEEYLKNEVKHFVTTRIQSFFNSEEIKQIDDPDILIDLMQSMMKSQKIS